MCYFFTSSFIKLFCLQRRFQPNEYRDYVPSLASSDKGHEDILQSVLLPTFPNASGKSVLNLSLCWFAHETKQSCYLRDNKHVQIKANKTKTTELP